MKKTAVQIKFPSQFSKFIFDIDSLEFEGETIEDFIDALEHTFGNIRERLFDSTGKVRPYINLYIGNKNIYALNGLDSVIPNGSAVSLLLSRAGG